MRKRNYLLLFCLMGLPTVALSESLFGGLTQDYSALTNCQNGKEIEEEFSKLFKVIKSDILGGKPKFCEAYKKNTLNKQINEKSNEFDQFMTMLSKIPGSKESRKNLLSLKDMDHKEIFFEVAKMVAIKKHWGYVDEDKRDRLLLNDACSRAQINKFPLPEKKYQSQFKIEGFTSDKIVESLCLAQTMDQILFGLDKDIIAETFLNLKQMFPNDYSKFTDYFCLEVMNLPEALALNFNSNSISNTKDLIASSEQFSKWLNDSYRTIATKEERAKNLVLINTAASKKVQADNNKLLSLQMQDKYKLIYDSKKPNEKAIDPTNPDFEIIKNSKNLYVAKKISSKNIDEMMAKIEKNSQENVESYIAKIKDGKIQIPNVTFVKKGEKIEFKINKEKHEEILSAIENTFKEFNKGQEEKKQNEASGAGQVALEHIYNQYKNLADKDDLLFPGDKSPVFINAQGKYEKVEDDFTSGQMYKKTYDQELKHIKPIKIGRYEILPAEFGTFYAKNSSGQYLQIYLEDKNKSGNSNEAFEAEEEDEEAAYQYNNPKAVRELHNALSVNYQKADKTLVKMTQLSADEVASIKSYTGAEYYLINSCLRKENCADALSEKAKNLKNALSKLSDKEKPLVLYRGVAEMPEEIVAKLDANQKVVLDKGFMSTSGSLSVASSFSGQGKADGQAVQIQKGMILMIKAKSCVGISALSYYETEDEFLCPPGLKFQTKKVMGTNQYILEEVEK